MIPPSRRFRYEARQEALGVHLELGLRAYDAGDLASVRRHLAAVAMLPEGGPGCLAGLALRWRLRWLEGDHLGALELLREATRRFPADTDTVLELSDVLQELDRPLEALEALVEAVRAAPDDADLWHEVGVAAERAENWDVRVEAFTQVWQLEHDREPAFRLWLPEERFIAVAEAALERLPPLAAQALGNVVVIIEDYPERWILDTDVVDPRLLGLFSGSERAHEAGVDHVAWGPATIHLFRWNIERVCQSAEEAEEQIAVTVRHEIGHYLGLDEEALHFRGLG